MWSGKMKDPVPITKMKLTPKPKPSNDPNKFWLTALEIPYRLYCGLPYYFWVLMKTAIIGFSIIGVIYGVAWTVMS